MTTRYQTTEYNRHARLASTVRDVYSWARHFCPTHVEIRANLTRQVYDTRDYRKLTPYYRGKLSGLIECLAESLYRADVVWQLYVDGIPRTSNEISAMRQSGDENVWARVEGAHVWAWNPTKLFSTKDKVA